MTGHRRRKSEVRGEPWQTTRREDEDERIGNAEASRKVMNAAHKLLATRSRSEGELRDRLSASYWAETRVVDDCIARLKELGYVNDRLFAHSYANYRVSSKPLGRARLARELALKKFSPDSIDEALDLVFAETPEETLIDRAIERRIRTHGRPTDPAGARKMFDYLARLGFEYDLIMRKLRKSKGRLAEIN
ncbi:MAG: regulatory protein RecX [Blastocatellia bacterium]